MKVLGDERGKLISLENNKNIPFEIKRVYWIYDMRIPDADDCNALGWHILHTIRKE